VVDFGGHDGKLRDHGASFRQRDSRRKSHQSEAGFSNPSKPTIGLARFGIARHGGLGENPAISGFPEQDTEGRQLDDDAPDPLMSAYLERREELVRYFRARLRSMEAAQDVVQDIGVRIARQRIDEIDNPSAYLYRLGSNIMLDHLKRERRVQRRATAWREATIDTDGGFQPKTEDPPADEVVSARERLKLIISTVDQMPAPVREAFRLHKLEGLSHAETAVAMGVSRSSVEKYIMAALKRIVAKVGR
jgi:RNA polymerase sigma-70 factor (ECF subfamily)